MARRKTADTVAIEGVKDKDDDGQIDESKNKRGVNREQGGAPDWRGAPHRKDQRFSRRSVRKSRVSVRRRMQTEMAAPSGQSKAAPKRLWTTLAIIVPEAPPRSCEASTSGRGMCSRAA